ncbi:MULTISPECIES: phage portal protein [unclassified Beijerinckia]|uniref:phage portal protein n=1 Tax=unclassified Beijerinckia TaxID=2638183 RepID=UPI000899F6E9|nr:MULTISPECIES: phage portal protein [unclassified Beijerinckia]MDH7795790.1 HK97 family phage portal protein [Beijerinckia sp. GAS462]SEC16514.1 phage portal protein, HK97 family [Beijerinckia sp. 28-YEA-48]
MRPFGLKNFLSPRPVTVPDTVEVKASTIAEPDADLFALFGVQPTLSNIAVTPSSAMRCAPVAAATALIKSTLATLPAKVFVRLDEGGKEPALEHPAYRLVHDDANPWTSAGDLRSALAGDAMLHGHGYAEVIRVGAGKAQELHQLDPTAITQLVADDGSPVYRIRTKGKGHRDLSYRDVLHIPSPIGISYVTAAREAIGLSLLLEKHAANLFAKGARPSGVVTMPGQAPSDGDDKKKRDFIRLFKLAFSGDNVGTPAVLFGGATFQPHAFSSVDAQFQESRLFQLREIARVWNVPVSMIGDLERATYSNTEQQNLQFLTHTILPWLRTFQEAYRRVLISEDDQRTHVIDFVTDDLLRADSATRAEAIAKQRAAGTLTANEARALENRPPLPGGDKLENPYTTSNTKDQANNG